MPIHLRLFVSALLVFLAVPALGATPPPAPRWPLDLPTRFLTSNFMEYRSGRFHAGIDLKTESVVGFPVRAAEDGWVLRVRATATAYGRVVYVRGGSGHTYVYAHLSRFNDELGARLDQQRAKTGRYRAELEFRPGQIPVKQGDVLGLTGESGTGGPHLHFEVRDAANRPLDPQAVGFAVGDTIAPVISRVRIWPASPTARVAGQPQEFVLAAEGGLRGAQPGIIAAGPVAFSARITDAADIRGHSLEPALIEVHVDDRRVYSCRNTSYDFSQNAQQRLEWVALPGVREHWLHRPSANRLSGREGDLWYLGAAGQGLSPGVHRIRISAEDQTGNRTEVRFDLTVVAPTGNSAPGPQAAGGWQASPVSLSPRVGQAAPYLRLSPFFAEVLPGAEMPAGLERLAFDPKRGDPVLAPLEVFRRPVVLDTAQRQSAAEQGLRLLGEGHEFLAADWPIEAALPVAMTAPDTVGTAGQVPPAKAWFLLRWNGSAWTSAGPWPTGAAGAPATVRLGAPGLYAVGADTAGPFIGTVSAGTVVGPGSAAEVAGVTMPVWEVLPLGLTDAGSGLAEESIRVLLDGEHLIVEPDLPRDRILIELPAAMGPGPHLLAIEARDEAGHVSRREVRFEARR